MSTIKILYFVTTTRRGGFCLRLSAGTRKLTLRAHKSAAPRRSRARDRSGPMAFCKFRRAPPSTKKNNKKKKSPDGAGGTLTPLQVHHRRRVTNKSLETAQCLKKSQRSVPRAGCCSSGALVGRRAAHSAMLT